MRKKLSKKIVLLVLLTSYFLLFFNFAFAVEYLPLVPCGLKQPTADEIAAGKQLLNSSYYQPCTRCDSFKLAHNVISFILYGLVPPVATVLFIYGGFVILLAGAKPDWISHGKKVFWNTFIGLLIILASWLIVNTFIQSFGPDQVKGSWFKFTCQDSVITPGGPPPSALCSNPAGLAAQYNVPLTPTNALELNNLISCIRSNLPGQNLGEISTYQKTGNTICNLVRGNRVCGSCIHEVNSCHYGGASGSQGALAVDFGNEDIGDKIIGVAVQQCGAKNGRCEDSDGNTIGCTNSRATHVHINSRSCDRN